MPDILKALFELYGSTTAPEGTDMLVHVQEEIAAALDEKAAALIKRLGYNESVVFENLGLAQFAAGFVCGVQLMQEVAALGTTTN